MREEVETLMREEAETLMTEEETQTLMAEDTKESGKMRSGDMKKNGQMRWMVSGTLMELLPNGPTTTSKEIGTVLMPLWEENGMKMEP